jgi:hypothetical protein
MSHYASSMLEPMVAMVLDLLHGRAVDGDRESRYWILLERREERRTMDDEGRDGK